MNCRLVILLIPSVLQTLLAEAQSVSVQFIHNSPDPAVEIVDVWINDSLWADNIPYHAATPMQLVADVSSAQWKIRHPADSSITYHAWTTDLGADSKNIFVLNGQWNSELYSPGRPLSVEQFDGALELSASTGSVDILFFQGASELDAADIAETQLFQLTAFDQLPYGAFSPYINLFSADYGWGILNQSGADTLGEFTLPVVAQNWAGKAITIVTGGFLNQTDNNFGHALGMWATTRDGGPMICLSPLQWNVTANVQFIHHTNLAASDNIRIEIDSIGWYPNLDRHAATPFTPFPAGKDVILSIHSNLVAGPVDSIWQDTIHLFSGRNYQFIWFDSLQSESGAQLVIHAWEESQSLSSNQMLLRLFNGSKQHQFIDLLADTVSQSAIFSNISFGNMSDTIALEIGQEEWILAELNDSLTTFDAPLDTLNLAQRNVTALTFSETNNPIPSLWLCSEFGGPMHPLSTLQIPELPQFCTIQLIHASADTLLHSIRIRINESLLVSPLLFETATEFLEVQCNDSVLIAISTNENPNTIVKTDTLSLTANETHRLYLWGILDTPHYNPAPELDWKIESSVETESSVSGHVDVTLFHAATDLGVIDILESTTPATPIFEAVSTGEFSSTQSLSAQNDYSLELRNAPTQFLYSTYNLPALSYAWENHAVTLITTGFRQPANNSNGQSLQLWALTADGNMIPLDNSLNTATNDSADGPKLFPIPVSNILRIHGIPDEFQHGRLQIRTTSGILFFEKELNGPDSLKNLSVDVSHLPNGSYILTATGQSKTECFHFCICR
jgi:hypothetical protein